MQGRIRRLTLAVAVLATALAWGTAGAQAATGGTAAPGGSRSAASGGTGPKSPGTAATTAHTGGISPSSVRTPSAPVRAKKPKKPKKRKRGRRRHPASHAPAPAPQPAPTPAAPTPAPNGGAADIPSRYLSLYKAAGAKYGVDWWVLAAIGKNESDHGRSTAPGVASGRNFADCCSGPMQICTVKACSNVWQYYAIDADGDGVASVYDPDDSIYAAAALVHDLETIVGTDPGLLLAAYNAGPGNVKKYKGVPPFAETKAYVSAGLAYIASLR